MKYVKTIDEALSFVKDAVTTLEKKAEEIIPSPMKVVEMPKSISVSATSTGWWKIDSRNFYGSPKEPETIEQVDTMYAQALVLIEKDIEALAQTHEVNKQALEVNAIIHEKVRLIMKDTLKIPDTYSTSAYKSSRSSKLTYTTHQSGWSADLQRNIKTTDGYDTAVKSVKGYKDSFDRIAKSLKDKILLNQREKDKVDADKKSTMALIRMQVKYGLDEDSTWSEVQETLMSKCDYLRLASSMESVRNDWNEGFGAVEYALDKFAIASQEDQEIQACISEILSSDETDGRIFRDCEWNYSVLYGKVSAELMSDYAVLQEHYEEY